MEAPISAALGAIGSLLRKVDLLLESSEEVNGCRLRPHKGAKYGMHLLKDDLEEISSYVQDLSELEDPPLVAKCWMKEARELSYDIEDYIDRFVFSGHVANIKARSGCRRISHIKIARLLETNKKLIRRKRVAAMISDFRSNAQEQEAIERYKRYELDCCTSRRRFEPAGRLPTTYEAGADVIIDRGMIKFMDSLDNGRDQQLKVVSVVGSGGIGKTTFVKLLYKKLKGHFDCRAFIRLTRKPDIKTTLRDILTQVQRQLPHDHCEDLDLIGKIREHIQHKRYLIVIDDLWSAAMWDVLSHAFPGGGTCSRIIITTQIEEGCTVCKDDLVKQWVAEGFIDAAEGRTGEIAESYFHELIARGLLQPAVIRYNSEVVSCSVHDVAKYARTNIRSSQLRYLKVASDVCIELPKHMQGLQYLETLDIGTKISHIPWDIIHLPCLLHLCLPFERNLMDWISAIPASVWSLGKLTSLQYLYLTCSIPVPDHLQRNMEALGSLLGGHGNLKTLVLILGSAHENAVVHGPSEVKVSWDDCAPPLLERFEWLPHIFTFSRVPKWMGKLGNLCILKISVAPVKRVIVFDKAGFSALKYFKFICSTVPCLKFEVDAMPNLKRLKLGFSAHRVNQHGTTPISIDHLPGLEEISAKVGDASSDIETVLTAAVSNHPRNPRIRVHLVDWSFYGDGVWYMVSKQKEPRILEDEILEEGLDEQCVPQYEDSRDDEKKEDYARFSEAPSVGETI
ncbi:unnamed protein product [Urochloa decumbens]|uniref:Uncharacterized protein n=1 Tax=Urochloa decumbens TaxID=240449 RepID=A0ABC8ZJ31_9POAL